MIVRICQQVPGLDAATVTFTGMASFEGQAPEKTPSASMLAVLPEAFRNMKWFGSSRL